MHYRQHSAAIEPLESRRLRAFIHPATSAHLDSIITVDRFVLPTQILAAKTTRGTIKLSADNVASFKLPGPLKFTVYAESTDYRFFRIGSVVQNRNFRANSIATATVHLAIPRKKLQAGDYFIQPIINIRRVDWVDLSSFCPSVIRIHVSD